MTTLASDQWLPLHDYEPAQTESERRIGFAYRYAGVVCGVSTFFMACIALAWVAALHPAILPKIIEYVCFHKPRDALP